MADVRNPGTATTLYQHVVVVRRGDRHEALHERRFADARAAMVPAGALPEVLQAACEQLGDLPRGRYLISVDWPHEREAAAS